MSPREWGLVAAGGALLTDQLSKLVLLYVFGFATLDPGVHVLATPFIDVMMAWNPGVSFSFLAAHSTVGIVALAAVAIAGIGALSVWLWRTTRPLLAVGLGLVIGGGISNNLIDRLVYGRVADFFDVHAMGRGFFVCNLADVAISLGVLMLLLDVIGEGDPATPPVGRGAE